MNANALLALLRAHDLGIDARKPLVPAQIATITRWRDRQEPVELSIAREEAVRLARRILEVTTQLAANQKRMTELIQQSPAAPLLEMVGAGAVTVATVLTAWSHPGRVRSEAAFASLAGVNPLPASSGNTVRHRLNRGGDRRLNRALHTITMTRMTHDSGTREYVAKRTQEGRSYREIRRSLKRYIARTLPPTQRPLRRCGTPHSTLLEWSAFGDRTLRTFRLCFETTGRACLKVMHGPQKRGGPFRRFV